MTDLYPIIINCPTRKTYQDNDFRFSQPDWCFSSEVNTKRHKIKDYESWYSDHSALHLDIYEEEQTDFIDH